MFAAVFQKGTNVCRFDGTIDIQWQTHDNMPKKNLVPKYYEWNHGREKSPFGRENLPFGRLQYKITKSPCGLLASLAPLPDKAEHVYPQAGDIYIDICIDTYIYILYTFAHIHTTYVYTRLHTHMYNIYTLLTYIYMYNLHIHIGTITISGGRGGTTKRWRWAIYILCIYVFINNMIE